MHPCFSLSCNESPSSNFYSVELEQEQDHADNFICDFYPVPSASQTIGLCMLFDLYHCMIQNPVCGNLTSENSVMVDKCLDFIPTSKMIDHDTEDEAEEEEFERFDDFTVASSWERFISEIEAVCRLWLVDGPKNLLEKGSVQVGTSKNLYKAKTELKYDMKSYSMEYYFQDKHDGKAMIWDRTLHEIQLSFGVNEFLIIAPQSSSGVVLDSPEASKLLSTVAIALSNCSSLWPSFVRVHDPSRKAYIGIQNMGTVCTRRFEADRIGSQVPVKLMHLEGLYELFVSKFAFSTLDFSTHLFKVQFTMKLTYKTLPHNDDGDYMLGADEDLEISGDAGGDHHHKTQWDDDCPWSEWYSAENPVKGFELITIWTERTIDSSLEMAEVENSSAYEAQKWLLLPEFSDILNADPKGNMIGFASQLSLLVCAFEMSFVAQFLEDFVSVEAVTDNMKSSAAIPPPTAVDRVLKELFHEEPAGVKLPEFAQDNHKSSRAVKGAHLESLFAQFCLHSLWLSNCSIRAISMLWIEFVREVRWYWEESQPLPKMPTNGGIDLSTCLINQKLQMLALCIEKKHESNQEFYDATDGKEDLSGHNSGEDGQVKEDLLFKRVSTGNFNGKSDSKLCNPIQPDNLQYAGSTSDETRSCVLKLSSSVRRGSAGFAGSMMLLNLHQRMHAPFTQDAPLMTEDMHEERLRAVEAFGDSFSFSAQLEREILSSDMSAFKAANPEAIFEDFIRWHSPGDWESIHNEEDGASGTPAKDAWPPQGLLSKRMSEHGNFWRKLWNEAPALPSSDQKPLLDPNREGEKVLHYLETLQPHQLLEQMVCTAFRASADTLNQTTYGHLNEMNNKLDQLYLTMASMLRPLQANQLSQDSEITQDLKRLCVIFEHTEKLMHLAASVHRKFVRAPRLSKAIFSDYYNFYLPRMGSASNKGGIHKGFDVKQLIRVGERNAVAEMFTPPNANQSWRKVLSMGNLLNGHEPVLREIIFSTREDASGNHYAARAPQSPSCQEMDTYRMYICGTSNDLRVALSIAIGTTFGGESITASTQKKPGSRHHKINAICLIVTRGLPWQQIQQDKIATRENRATIHRLHRETSRISELRRHSQQLHRLQQTSHNFIWAIETHKDCQLFPRESAYHQQRFAVNRSQVKSTAPTTASVKTNAEHTSAHTGVPQQSPSQKLGSRANKIEVFMILPKRQDDERNNSTSPKHNQLHPKGNRYSP
ncbi:hypothetical protein Nepgr_009290 [Nepenthes gracilis]|uniref:Rab3 GTPase-activating protein catalytic subunit n=1 Tax=Nepenthes gracilis TaxID=150966 RepID=A0AAD3SAI5_NEPGR|nr:hypothetical protein Nepgr_009290 [Nepenthes gracilis]